MYIFTSIGGCILSILGSVAQVLHSISLSSAPHFWHFILDVDFCTIYEIPLFKIFLYQFCMFMRYLNAIKQVQNLNTDIVGAFL